MVVQSRYNLNLPSCSLSTLIFGSPNDPLPNDEPCLLDHERPGERYLTRHTFRLWSKRFAAGLQAAGLQLGDRVLLFSANNLLFPVVFNGVIMAGGIFTACNPTFSAEELAHQIRDCGPKFILCQRGAALDTCLEAERLVGTGHSRRIFQFDDDVLESTRQLADPGCPYWGELIAPEASGEQFSWDSLTGPNEAAGRTLALNYSSGTTGVSKGVEITHKNYVANVCQHNYLLDGDEDWRKRAKGLEKWLCVLPLYHAMAQMIYIGVSQLRQTPVYIMSKFDFVTFLRTVERYRITDLHLVPPIIVMLAKRQETRQFDLSSVRSVLSGAAPLDRKTSETAEAVFPNKNVNIKQGWGMTECTCAVLGWESHKTSDSNSIGWPNPNSAAKIMSLQDQLSASSPFRHELGPHQIGELWVRGPQIMKRYWMNPGATSKILTADGWLKSGDLGYYDDEGKFFITGRLKELIKVKGLQVAPAELDAVCLQSDIVADAAVVGVTINGAEQPRAYIVLKPGVPATDETATSIQVEVNEKLAKHKHITAGVVFVEALPKNPSGKLLRRQLREKAQSDIEERQEKKGKKALL